MSRCTLVGVDNTIPDLGDLLMTFGCDTIEIMALADAPNGRTVEVIDGPAHNMVRSGRIYKLGGVANHLTGQRYAWKRFTNERAVLAPTLRVIIADEYTDEEGRWVK